MVISWPLLFSGAALIFSIGCFFYCRLYIKKRTNGETVLARIREEINHILIRVDETTNRDITLLEDKEEALKALLDETEKRLKVYTRELDRSLRNEKAYRELAGIKSGAAVKNGETVPPGELAQEASAHPASTAAEKAENPPAGNVAPEEIISPHEIASSPGPVKTSSIAAEIRRLVNSGISPPLIASKLGISISEVELASALMERKPL